MTRLATVCARGGSKGVPGKNLAIVGGLPLVAHSVRHAVESGLFEAIAISSDDADIRAAGLAAGATIAVERPADLASDTAGKVPAICHAVLVAEERLERSFATVVDLDATSPLRTVDDVRAAVLLMEKTGAPSVITGCPARRSPYFNQVELRSDGTVAIVKPMDRPVLRRQDSPAVFDMNASIYVWQRDALMHHQAAILPGTRLFVMPEERSHDVDTALDLEIVRLIWNRSHGIL
ncbi:acylneuraminate cytidylyltransferase family protein [Thermaurantiacus sp.]